MAEDFDTGPDEDPFQEQMDAAERLARLVSGDDDRRFIFLFQSLVNVLDSFAAHPGNGGADQARLILARTADPPAARGRKALRAADRAPGQPTDSIYTDPVFIENAKKLIPHRKRIIGGIPTAAYPDCVAVGSTSGWCCSGTLVAPNVVVSAAHCVAGGCANRVFTGPDVGDLRAGQVIPVLTAVTHPDYGPPDFRHDLSVLILAQDASCAPRRIAGPGLLESAASVRLAGFGNTDVLSSGGYGRRRIVDVPLAMADSRYGADPATEFVAGAPFLDRDSCNGDSGGPAYVQGQRSWYLAGATSRATASTVRPCGDGGIYTRIDAFADWMRSIPGGHWA